MSQYRVLRLITWLPAGGIERKIAAVLPRLNSDLFEAHVCCIREPGPLAAELENEGIPVHVIPFKSRWDPGAMLRLRKLVRRLKIDVIHSHMYRSNLPATVMKMWDSRLVVVGHYHNVGTWESSGQLWMDRWLSAKRDLNVTVSEAVRTNVSDMLRLPAWQTRTLYNGVDVDEFHPISAAQRHQVRERLGLPVSAKIVVMLARLVPQKNHQLVLESAPEILSAVPRAHFLFVGKGPEEPRLHELAARLRIEDRVTFLGGRDDVPQILAACDISILPSLKEGFSNAILESMACGLPVVASDVGGNREVIDHGGNGFIVDRVDKGRGRKSTYEPATEVNATQFIRYVKRLLTEEDLRSRQGAAALRHVQSFSIDAMVQEIEDTYLELLEGEHHGGNQAAG
jgi:glycosyltransferase involved in cell wall biosynthesis